MTRKCFERKRPPIDWGPLPPQPKQFDVLDVSKIVTDAIPRAKRLSGVYFLIDKNRIVYVGQSANFEERLHDHRVRAKVWDRYYFIECPAEDLAAVERMYIDHFCPKYNVDRPFNDPSGIRNAYRPQQVVDKKVIG